MQIPITVGITSLALLGGCTTHSPADGRSTSFTLNSWALQNAVGCFGEHEVVLADGSVMHELYACAGDYSDARCTVARAIPDELVIVRCAYALTIGRKVREQVRYLSCGAPSADMTKCGADSLLWTDAGTRGPAR
ncbi:hypothetical protein M9M90_13425 [Phenylobacterium sp. LH3H17]|uniref:hypothetical protein n=1 Tax=Phenylobacterium sp. LH3H17 TaxID=2903901 RepID=UPI0020CA1CB6|nr:hypothetical protein [Phenylobacterium sp. LH3H17]UTP38219.1 hypothetical protein M9M90_13425 [Phenylobacterium sp. LH3H17]